jgi:diadenosine tetraphosphate (Ap4A) HIT family hydrolase
MTTVFTRIINGEIPGTFVYRDDRCVVFLSVNPLAPGHALVVPITEIDHWVDLPSDIAAHLFEVAGRIGRAQQAAFHCERVGLIIAGYEVPHAHLHVVPTTHIGQFDFATAAAEVDRDEIEAAAVAIRTALGTG